MFGGNLKLTADMVLNKPFYKGIAFIINCIIKSYAASDKHFFDLWNLRHFFKKFNIFAVVNNEIFAGFGSKTASVFADTLFVFNGYYNSLRTSAMIVLT